MQLPAPMHLWRSTRARMAISGEPTAASPRKASEVASARLEAPSRASSRARRWATVVLAEVELGGDLGVRAALGQELQQAALGVVEVWAGSDAAGAGPGRGSGGRRVHRAGELDELAPERAR